MRTLGWTMTSCRQVLAILDVSPTKVLSVAYRRSWVYWSLLLERPSCSNTASLMELRGVKDAKHAAIQTTVNHHLAQPPASASMYIRQRYLGGISM